MGRDITKTKSGGEARACNDSFRCSSYPGGYSCSCNEVNIAYNRPNAICMGTMGRENQELYPQVYFTLTKDFQVFTSHCSLTRDFRHPQTCAAKKP